MARGREDQIEHLLRRAGFGATQAEVDEFADLGFSNALDVLLEYERIPDAVDSRIQTPGYVGVTARGAFSPNTSINDARQRWLFRMVHSQRPLQEKMALFWHNHFATAYSKIAGAAGATAATRMLAAKPSEDPTRTRGQLELLRQHALGNFRTLLLEISRDPAMLFWLDGRSNVRNRPQENYARELMELFTMGVGTFHESDVYAGARVFTGWNLQRQNTADDVSFQFFYNAAQHDTSAKEFSFPIYPDGGRRIPARSAGDGLQDGVDLIAAVARHPETGPRLARKLYAFFVSEASAPDEALVSDLANEYYASGFEMKRVLRRLFSSAAFRGRGSHYARYSWPVDFVVRALKEVGWTGYSVADALTPLANMGQQLFEPPDVNGWDLGRGWFSSGAMLARMNFAAQLATNQKFALRDAARPVARTPEALLSAFLDRITAGPLDADVRASALDYLRAGGAWTGSDTQLLAKAAGLAHVLVGSGEYQLL
jgi:uncharacterized protein (DUF1800 family)